MNPYTLADLPFLITLPLLLIMSGFFSGTETALFALNRQSQLQIVRSGGMVARAVEQLLYDRRMLLITLMFGNMVANVLFFVINSVLLLKLERSNPGPMLIAVATLAPLLLIIMFGEVLPKMVANTARLSWVRITAVPMFAIHQIIAPLRIVLGNFVITPLSRLIEPQHAPPELSAEELETLVKVSEEGGVIDRDEEQLLRSLVQLGQVKVRDVMVPRVDIAWVDINTPPAEVRKLIHQTRLKKLPVCLGDLDHVEGVIFPRQFLLADASNALKDIRPLVQSVHFVPEIQRCDQLVTDFRGRGISLAIAVDEYGGTAGLITLKDALEPVMGDLGMDQAPGEGDHPDAERVDKHTWRVSARLGVNDWAETFGQRNIPVRVSTVGGLVMTLLGDAPKVDDRVTLGNVEMRVERMSGRGIDSVLLRLITEEQTGEDDA